jgi:hypothetical protein
VRYYDSPALILRWYPFVLYGRSMFKQQQADRSGLSACSRAMTCCEAARYAAKFGGTTSNSPQSRAACAIGMAESTPNLRAI